MHWVIEYVEEKNIVTLKTSGINNFNEHKQMVAEALRVAKNKCTKLFLVDNRNLEPGLTIIQIDDLPGLYKKIGVKPEHKIAVLYSPMQEEKFKFFQSVSFLASLNFRIFTDEQKAMEWLLKKGKE